MLPLNYAGRPLTPARLLRAGRKVGRRARFSTRRLLGCRDIVTTTPWGARIKLGFSNPSALSMFCNAYEPDEIQVVDDHVTAGATVLDVGANIGYMTLLLAARVGHKGRVHAFEPNPPVADALVENLALNPDTHHRITVHRFALGAVVGDTEFYSPIDGHEGVGGLRNTARAPLDRVIHVPVRTLDSFVQAAGITSIGFIKLDVEGGEWDVLRGGEDVLSTHRPVILFEAYDGNTRPYGYRVFELLSYLEQRGYQVTQAGPTCNFVAVPR